MARLKIKFDSIFFPIRTYSEHSFNAVTNLLAIDILSFNWMWSDRSEISVRAATALATTYTSTRIIHAKLVTVSIAVWVTDYSY